MKNIMEITKLTFKEAMSKKIFITFLGLSTFVLLLFAIVFGLIPIEDFNSMIRVNGKSPVDFSSVIVDKLKMFMIFPLYGGGLFLSVFSVSGFIPAMLEKGNIDLLLSKPISRAQLILGKYFGGILIVLMNITYLVLGLWLLIGIKFAVWNISFLVTIPVIVFAFAVLYSLIIFIGIITRSSLLAIMLSYLIFFILSPLLAAKEAASFLTDGSIWGTIIDILYYVIPQTSELGGIATDIAAGGVIADMSPIWVSIIFIFLTIFGTITIFDKKEY